MPEIIIVGVCPKRETIGRAVEQLESLGFAPDEIGVVIRADPEDPLPDARIETQPDAGTTAAAGGVIGAVAGAGITGLIAIAGLTLSGFGVLAAGPLAGILAAAASGGVAGGLTGAMIGVGVPEDVARRYETQLDAGVGVALIAVSADTARVEAARSAMAEAGVREVQAASRQGRIRTS